MTVMSSMGGSLRCLPGAAFAAVIGNWITPGSKALVLGPSSRAKQWRWHEAGASLTLALLSAGAALRAEEGTAIFAAGCFWCVEEAFDGVFSGARNHLRIPGSRWWPTYRQAEETGTEALEVHFDPGEVSYAGFSRCSGATSIPLMRADSSGPGLVLPARFSWDEAANGGERLARGCLRLRPGTLVTPIREATSLAEDHHRISPEKSLALQVLQKRLRPAAPA